MIKRKKNINPKMITYPALVTIGSSLVFFSVIQLFALLFATKRAVNSTKIKKRSGYDPIQDPKAMVADDFRGYVDVTQKDDSTLQMYIAKAFVFMHHAILLGLGIGTAAISGTAGPEGHLGVYVGVGMLVYAFIGLMAWYYSIKSSGALLNNAIMLYTLPFICFLWFIATSSVVVNDNAVINTFVPRDEERTNSQDQLIVTLYPIYRSPIVASVILGLVTAFAFPRTISEWQSNLFGFLHALQIIVSFIAAVWTLLFANYGMTPQGAEMEIYHATENFLIAALCIGGFVAFLVAWIYLYTFRITPLPESLFHHGASVISNTKGN